MNIGFRLAHGNNQSFSLIIAQQNRRSLKPACGFYRAEIAIS
jgi:hypothetical protein